MIKRWLLSLFSLLLLFAVGCGGDKDKGINKDRDRPRAAPASNKPQ